MFVRLKVVKIKPMRNNICGRYNFIFISTILLFYSQLPDVIRVNNTKYINGKMSTNYCPCAEMLSQRPTKKDPRPSFLQGAQLPPPVMLKLSFGMGGDGGKGEGGEWGQGGIQVLHGACGSFSFNSQC